MPVNPLVISPASPVNPPLHASINIDKEMRTSYLDYAMSVIISRALPDLRDGLKPVHRRILFSMDESGFDYNKPFRKCARIIGEVMGKYHPHGDSAIYDALVRLAQDFSIRLPLIDSQGNFGSIDGDPPAAHRYTEARLDKSARFLLADTDKDTVDFKANYDNSIFEPLVLPAAFPHLLVNGSSGIAVGMATNIPTHNLGEVIDATILLLKDPTTDLQTLMQVLPGPDFPTGGIILGTKGILEAYQTGRGIITLRAVCEIESDKHESIVISQIPYQVNKARMIEKIAQLVNDKVIVGIRDIRDESSKEGLRVVIELKRDAEAHLILNQLYKHSQLQVSFGINMLAILNNRPICFDIITCLREFINFREEVIKRRSKFELKVARDRAHLLLGFMLALSMIDKIIAIIKQSGDSKAAQKNLMEIQWNERDIKPYLWLINSEISSYQLNEEQAKAILELRLQRLTALEQDKILEEISQIKSKMTELEALLGSQALRYSLMERDLLEIKGLFADNRRTQIEVNNEEIQALDLIPNIDVVILISVNGYIKRVNLDVYRAQNRGGKGKSAVKVKQEDIINSLLICKTHNSLLFFSTFGKVYSLSAYQIPEASNIAIGKAIINLLPLSPGEKIATIMVSPTARPKNSNTKNEDKVGGSDSTKANIELNNELEGIATLEDELNTDEQNNYIFFVTSLGGVRRNSLSDFANIRSNGKIAIKLDTNEEIITVLPCKLTQDICLMTKLGKCIRFSTGEVREFVSTSSNGVRGMKLSKNDRIISACLLNSITATSAERDKYLRTNRTEAENDSSNNHESNNLGGNSSERNEHNNEDYTLPVATAPTVGSSNSSIKPHRLSYLQENEQDLLCITKNGIGKRTSAYEYRTTGRGGLGYANISLKPQDEVVDSFAVNEDDEFILVTNQGQLLRGRVSEVRVSSRNTQGVIVMRLSRDEYIVSVASISSHILD